MKRGDKVHLRLQADVIAVREHEPKLAIQLTPYGAAGAVGMYVSTDEVVDPTADWREICADMIRLGRDREAVALLVEKSPHAVPYIKALEDLLAAFAKLPAEDAYERMVWKDAQSDMFGGKVQARDKIESYIEAVRAWKGAMSVRQGPDGVDHLLGGAANT